MLSDNASRVARIVTGIVFGILTIYTVVALVSYVFTWHTDQSLRFEESVASTSVTAENSGGKLGFIWADFLISKLFGFGAFVLCDFLFHFAVMLAFFF